MTLPKTRECSGRTLERELGTDQRKTQTKKNERAQEQQKRNEQEQTTQKKKKERGRAGLTEERDAAGG